MISVTPAFPAVPHGLEVQKFQSSSSALDSNTRTFYFTTMEKKRIQDRRENDVDANGTVHIKRTTCTTVIDTVVATNVRGNRGGDDRDAVGEVHIKWKISAVLANTFQ